MTSVAQRTVRLPGTRRKTCPCCRQPWFVGPPGTRYVHERAVRVERFFAKHLKHTKGPWKGKPFILDDWQFWHIIAPIFGLLEDGTEWRWFRNAVILLARKQGKSEVAAGCAAYLLTADGEGAPEVYSLAGSETQAKVVFNMAKRMMKGSPLLRRMANFYANVIEVPDSMGIYRALSSDAEGAHGSSPSGAVVDEFWTHPNDELREAMTTGIAARPQPLILTISTAPRDRSGPMWDLMQPYVEPAPDDTPRDPRTYFWGIWARRDDDAGDPRVWRRVCRASWLKPGFMAEQYASLPLKSFEQFHLNRVPSGKRSSWLPKGAWERGNRRVFIDANRPAVLTVDAAPKRDSTALILAQMHDGGEIHVRCWVFRADENLGYLDFEVVEGMIRDLCREFYVTRAAVDPYAMMRSLMLLAAEGLPMEDFPQNYSRMVPASMGLHQLILDRMLVHGGDPELEAAVSNATTTTTSSGWRLVQIGERQIDALIALAMAVWLLQSGEVAGASPNVMVV